MTPKERLCRPSINQPRVKWSVGTSSCSRCNTTEAGISTLVSAGGLGIKKHLLTSRLASCSPTRTELSLDLGVGKKDNAPDRICESYSLFALFAASSKGDGPSAGVHAEAVVSSDAWGRIGIR
jgi:hypothetical protein